jgi:hypothetical protein
MTSMKITNKVPRANQITPVLAVTAIILYGWTTFRFIQKLPSWLLFLDFREILSNYAQTLVINLAEVLLFIGLIIVINFLLPRRLFMEMFVARGSLLAAINLGLLIYFSISIGQSKLSDFPWRVFQWAPLELLLGFLMAIFLPYVKSIRKVVEDIADRAIVFLYILAPLTGFGILFFLYNILV